MSNLSRNEPADVAGSPSGYASAMDDYDNLSPKEQKALRKAQKKEERAQQKIARKSMGGNRPWFVPTMLGLMLIGLVWVVVFYLSSYKYPIESLQNWNLGIGFAFIMAGFLMTTQWK
ncbi:putative septation inhibitor protein [Dermatophilus congolensis]|uniref:Cell division protein CrgA n=2 Tax=Dermatophilus congolensis TaxID=1863 RepID=A0AA46BQ37_9MICO|nr:putative septation inhibitor protein [Dermatophilus congolensis]